MQKQAFINTMTEQNIAYFFNGAAFMYFVCTSYFILKYSGRSRIQLIAGFIFGYWAVWNFKDIIYAFQPFHNERVLHTIIFLDGWSAVSYAVLLFELSMPGWVTLKRTAALLSPFLLFTALHIMLPSDMLLLVYWIYLIIFGLTIIFIAYFKVKRYQAYIHNNFQNIEHIDLSWLKNIFVMAFVSQLFWVLDSLYPTGLTDGIYYLSIIFQWHLVAYYCWNHKSIILPSEEELQQERKTTCEEEATVGFPFAGKLEQLIDEQELYRKTDLTLQDLVLLVGSNRTYLSDYFNKVLNTTFYNYINQQRIEKGCIPLITQHQELTIEAIACQAGFNSISTFRRAFQKETGMTPKEYRKKWMKQS